MKDKTESQRETGQGHSLKIESSRRYIAGLDGLRALSVLAVIAYHLHFEWASGGLLGVGIFFVLSGYLITDQIITNLKHNGRLDLKDFWIRRARRLLPAMFTMLVFVGVWLLLVDRARLIMLQGDFISSALYFNNWYLIFKDVSYFESFGPPSPIGHLWSLAIEEQYYIIWPLLLLIGLRIAPRRGKLILLILVGAVASALAMALIYEPGTDPSRVYYGTDTRVFGLLIGAALAIALPSQRMKRTSSTMTSNVLDLIGGISLVIIIFMIWKTEEYGSFLYYGGLLLLSILSAIVIAALIHPASQLGKWLGCKPLRWVGLRSYSIYIWHYPVIILTSSSSEIGEFNGLLVSFQLGLSFLLAALSYKYIEEPIRHGLLGRVWGKVRTRPQIVVRPLLLIVTSVIFLLCISYVSNLKTAASDQPIATTSPNPTDQPIATTSPNPTDQPIATTSPNPTDRPIATTSPNPTDRPIATTSPNPTDRPIATSSPNPTKQPIVTSKPEDEGNSEVNERSGEGITVIGDSIIIDTVPFLTEMLPGISIDGEIGRQMSMALDVIEKLKSDGKLGNYVIIELGTNGAFSTKTLRAILNSLSEVEQVILVNTRVPKQWQDTVNSTLIEVSANYSNASVLDWYSSSKDKDHYFREDNVHLTREGAEFYASLLANAIHKDEQ